MNTSEQINELATALSKAQADMKSLAVDKTNPHFKNKYATLAQVCDTVLPILAKNGLSIVQPVVRSDGALVVLTRLMHSSGQWIEGSYPITNDVNKPQAMGSALTYARRYSFTAMVCTAPDEDDDANAAQENGNGKSRKLGLSASVDEPDDRTPDQPFNDIQGVNGRPKYKGAANAAPEEYLFIQSAIRAQRSVEDLQDWGNNPVNKEAIAKLPATWIPHVKSEYRDRLHALQGAG